MKTITNSTELPQNGAEPSTPNTSKQSSKPQKTPSKIRSKSELIQQALKRKRGASLNELCTITGWQAHSLRGHISRTLRKKNKLNVVSDCTKSGIRRYRLIMDLT